MTDHDQRETQHLDRAVRHRGPITLRGGEPGTVGTTTDQRLLDRRGGSDFVHTDPWRVLRIQAEFVEGFGLLAELPRAVSVFGSARTARDSPYYATGVQIGAALAEAGYAVITGGGPGLMEGPNRGAHNADGLSVGLGIELPFEQGLNDWVDLGRRFAGEVPGPYTWWSQRGQAFDTDTGWRIDYQLATPELAALARSYEIDRASAWDTRWSDHAPVVVDYEL